MCASRIRLILSVIPANDMVDTQKLHNKSNTMHDIIRLQKKKDTACVLDQVHPSDF